MVDANIVVKVRRNEAIVRKVVLDDRGMVVAKYGLTCSGQWLEVPEGEAYPDECRVAVRLVDWLPQTGRELKGWLINDIWSLREWWGKRVAALKAWARRGR